MFSPEEESRQLSKDCESDCCLVMVYKIHIGEVSHVESFAKILWPLSLREEKKLRVFENMVLRRIFEPGRDEVTGKWRRLLNEELNDFTPHPIVCG